RVIRTLPLYFLIVLTAGIAKLVSDRIEFKFTLNEYWKYLLVIPNFVEKANNFILTNLWAVGVTEQFYLSWGGLILIFRRLTISRMLGLLGLVYFILLMFPGLIFYGNPLVYYPNFLIGALAAHFYNVFPDRDDLRRFFSRLPVAMIS